jgi:hypothetical protein
MSIQQILFALVTSILIIGVLYTWIGWNKILSCYKMWLSKKYWTNYNVVEAVSWIAKAIIIVPGLIFGLQIWQLYFLSLLTSAMLIWASYKKLLPTLVGFNTLWIWLSMMIIAQHVIE